MGARRSKSLIRAACVQVNAGPDLDGNVREAFRWARCAAQKNADLLVYPENFLYRGPHQDYPLVASRIRREIVPEFCRLARKLRLELLLGSLLLPSRVPGKYWNTSLHIGPSGAVLARYQKIHLFDIRISGVRVRESEYLLKGKRVVSSKVCGVRAGLSICYDLRFPELYRKLSAKGCLLFFVPSNFTQKTGESHWHTLLRARAIENQAFVLAPGQCGVHAGSGIRSYGHSLILDSWGRTLAEAGGRYPELILAELDLGEQGVLRKGFKVLSHRTLA